MLQKSINSFVYAVRGLKSTWIEERNFRIEVVASLLVFFCVLFFKFTLFESLFCILGIALVLSAEIVNTVVEDLCNKVEPQHDPVIGKIKDMMASFVLVSVGAAILIGTLVFYNHFQ